VADLPEDFIPDLRRLRRWPTLEGSPWRNPRLAALTFGELYRLTLEHLPAEPSKILEVGCGSGFLCLELARLGHDVTGVDEDPELIAVARRARDDDPYRTRRGALAYHLADIDQWREAEGPYDVVIFTRSLHHLSSPTKTLAHVRDLLTSSGKVLCLEYAYDQFDRRSALFLHRVGELLASAGWAPPAEGPEGEAVEAILRRWVEEHPREHGLRGLREMLEPLDGLFARVRLTWHPYLYWEVIEEMRVPDVDAETSLAYFLVALEGALISQEKLLPPLFRFVGSKSRHGGAEVMRSAGASRGPS
jgi:SAM-dependent methyltransferase